MADLDFKVSAAEGCAGLQARVAEGNLSHSRVRFRPIAVHFVGRIYSLLDSVNVCLATYSFGVRFPG